MYDDAAPPKRKRNSAVQRGRGRKGGRPPKHGRSVPPPDQAIPPAHKGGVGFSDGSTGTGPESPPVVFPCDPARWLVFCQQYGANAGKVSPAAKAAGLARKTVDDWFKWGAEGREPYRSEVAKALALLGLEVGHAGRTLRDKAPLEFLHRADPESYPRERQALDVTSGGKPIDRAPLAEAVLTEALAVLAQRRAAEAAGDQDRDAEGGEPDQE